MKKGKKKNICGVQIYVEYEKKSQEERGVMPRPVIFKSKKDYNRSDAKRKLRKEVREYAKI